MTEASIVNLVAQPCFYVQRLIMANKIQAENIEPMLKQLAVEAEAVNPALADKLKNLCRWIKGKSPGKLRVEKICSSRFNSANQRYKSMASAERAFRQW